MIKVKIVKTNGEVKEFVAQESWEESFEGRVVYWTTENGDLFLVPLSVISEVTERETE